MLFRAATTRVVLRCAFLASLLASVGATPVQAQNLRQRISDLFIFGEGQEPLFLAGSGDPNNPVALQAHGEHFIPASNAENSTLIATIGDALGASIGNIPIGSTSGSESFRFVGGVPVRTSTSAGPIFAERAQTLGKGRALVGISSTSFGFATLRGVDMRDIQLTFTHQNVDFPGESFAQLAPFGGTTSAHYFAGSATNPVLSASRQSLGSSAGLGDVALRAKVNLRETSEVNVAMLLDARFPTGSEDDL